MEQKGGNRPASTKDFIREIKRIFSGWIHLIGSVKETHLCGGDCRFDSYSINAVVT